MIELVTTFKSNAMHIKIKSIIFYTILSNMAFSQISYRNSFDYIDNNYDYSISPSNINSFSDGEAYVLRSYLLMYKSTSDNYYLNKFITHSLSTINYRGTLTYYLNASSDGAIVYDNGMICWPLIEFVCMVKMELPGLYSSNMSSSVTYNGTTYTTYGQYAELLHSFVKETVSAFDESNQVYNTTHNIEFWGTINGSSGYYYPNAAGNNNALVENNKQCAMGNVLARLSTLEPSVYNYKYKTQTIASRFKNMLSIDEAHYEWHHRWNESASSTNWEDMDHGALEIELAYYCYKNNFLYSDGSLIFNVTDMDRFARTITESVYNSPKYNWYTVYGNNDWYPTTSPEPVPHSLYEESCGQWVAFADLTTGTSIDRVGRDIFSIASYNFFHDYQSRNRKNDIIATRLVTLGYLNYFKSKNYSKLNYIAEDTTYGSASSWAGVAVGNIDGNISNGNELVMVRNYDGDFFLEKLNSGFLQTFATNTDPGSNSQWKGVAAGDFDGNGKDEIVALRNIDGDIFLYSYEGGVLVQKNRFDAGNLSNWAGIASGDFNNDGKDEFVAIRNYDSKIFLFTVESNVITFKSSYIAGGTSSVWAGICVGDFDGIPGDEIAAVRNYDKKIFIYKVSGNIITEFNNFQPFTNLSWDGIAAGYFSGISKADIVLHSNTSGDYYFFNLNASNNLQLNHQEYFLASQNNAVFAMGKVVAGSQLDNFVYLRNVDGAALCMGNNSDNIWRSDNVIPVDDNVSQFAVDNSFFNHTNDLNNDCIVYPTIVSDCVNIIAQTGPVEYIDVINLSGEIVDHIEMTSNKAYLADLKSGMYILKIYVNGYFVNKKIIKQ